MCQHLAKLVQKSPEKTQ